MNTYLMMLLEVLWDEHKDLDKTYEGQELKDEQEKIEKVIDYIIILNNPSEGLQNELDLQLMQQRLNV